AEQVAEAIIKKTEDYGIQKVSLQARNPGLGRDIVIKKISESKSFEIEELVDKTPLAFNGTRPRKKPLEEGIYACEVYLPDIDKSNPIYADTLDEAVKNANKFAEIYLEGKIANLERLLDRKDDIRKSLEKELD
ncbi:14732_t:CDS:2, partial [Racocetra fulgida]